MQQRVKILFLIGLLLGAGSSVFFLSSAIEISQAADVTVTGTVPGTGGGGDGDGDGDGDPPENCGDDNLDAEEQCDDGNILNGDGCSSSCQLEDCGNTVIDPPWEECDLGSNFNSNDPNEACRTDCKDRKCGDGITDNLFSEACDDGDTNDGSDLCDTENDNWNSGLCTWTFCGDGVVQTPNGGTNGLNGFNEECDDKDGAFNGACAGTPTNFCNNDSDCDPGDTCNLDSCSSACTLQLVINPVWVTNVPFDSLNPTNPPITSGEVNWWTTIASDSTLRWGLPDGIGGCVYSPVEVSASQVLVHTLAVNPLTLNTTYCYQVTSVSGVLTDTKTGSFVTGGGPTIQICGNGVQEGTEACDLAPGNTTEGNCDIGNLACNLDSDCAVGANGPCIPDGCSADCSTINTLLCGNGVVEAGEQCDLGDGVNSDTLPNTCRTDCSNPYCGDDVIDLGEVCDDGLDNSDTAADACRLDCTPARCGDGIEDSGEACDLGSIIYSPGDACTPNCNLGLLINNHSETILSDTAARIDWTTNLSGDSTLEWGELDPVDLCNYDLPNEISSATLTTSHSLDITSGLDPALVYCYRVTSSNGVTQDSETDIFSTGDQNETICDDGIDNDNNGFCDYEASTCTDGSIPGDPDCLCVADFDCQVGACISGIEDVACTDQNVCQLDYQFDQGCTAECTISCGPGQTLDIDECECIDQIFCGNHICERPTENEFNCVQDCPVDCLPDWDCTGFGECINGIQAQDCFDLRACGSNLGRPDTTQSCTPGCDLTCGLEESLNIATCVCEQIVPFCGNDQCEIGENFANCSEDCIEVCTPNWTCLGWGNCVDDTQTRECYDLNACSLDLDRPPEIRSCLPGCDVACSTCEEINLAACACSPIANCCGNASCEEFETTLSCGVDCGLPPGFRLALTACLDGLDNDNDGFIDYPQDAGCKTPGDNSERDLNEIFENLRDFVINNIFDNPVVEEINERIAAPAIIALVALSTFSSFSLLNLLSYLRYLFTEPLAIIARRKRRKWGTVYNALTKKPVDLAIVRLYVKDTGRLLQSRVTDKQGRFSLLVEPGTYYITVTKPKFDFPTVYLKDKKEDNKYVDLYHGETVEVTDKRVTITVNIPLDPKDQTAKPAAKVILAYYLRKIQFAVAFSAVPLAGLSFAISPGLFTGSLLGFHLTLFLLFRRLGYQKPPKNWGVVYDEASRKPVGRAIARIYDKQYNKLLETRVTDAKGRYAFLVDNNIYYVTAERLGYKKFKTKDIDLARKDKDAFINVDIGMNKADSTKPPAEPPLSPPVSPISPPTTPQVPTGQQPLGPPQPPQPASPTPQPPSQPEQPSPPPAPDGKSVGRESLEEMLADKQTQSGQSPAPSSTKPPVEEKPQPAESKPLAQPPSESLPEPAPQPAPPAAPSQPQQPSEPASSQPEPPKSESPKPDKPDQDSKTPPSIFG